jgi:ADP-ribose pyrophosphatase YjhB (NUDIX family)
LRGLFLKTWRHARSGALSETCPSLPSRPSPILCTQCGDTLIRRLVIDDTRERLTCTGCGHIHYENPRVLVACLVSYADRVLLCRRAIEPAYGLWTPPGGFLENGETLEEATAREVWEEAGVKLLCRDLTLRGVTTLTELQQVYVHFSANTRDSNCRAGNESLDAMFFKPCDIPWDRLAFPSVAQDIRQFLNERVTGHTRARLTCES